MMIKPPGYFWRIRVFEVDYDVLIAIKQFFFPRVFGLMRHSREVEFRFLIKNFSVETIENSRGSGTITAAIVKTQSDLGHRERELASTPSAANERRGKALKDGRVTEDCQAESS